MNVHTSQHTHAFGFTLYAACRTSRMASAPLIGSISLCIQIRSDFDFGPHFSMPVLQPSADDKAASVLNKLPRTASALPYCSQHQLVDVSQAITCDNVKQSYACGKAFTRVNDKHGSFILVTQPARCPQIWIDENASFISEPLQVQYMLAPKVDALHNLLVGQRQLQVVHLSANSQGQCLMITPQNHDFKNGVHFMLSLAGRQLMTHIIKVLLTIFIVQCYLVGLTNSNLPRYAQTCSKVSVYKPSCISDY